MIIRALEDKDIEQVTKIHNEFYKDEFALENFNHLIERAFVIEKHDKIICAGGIKSIAEVVLVTDKSINNFTRVKALKQSLNIFGYIARQTGHDSIHAFIQDDAWRNHLINEGFEVCKGTPIFLEV